VVPAVNPFITDVNYPVDAFIKEEAVYKFFMEELSSLLKNYEPGLGKFKPDVIDQFETIQTERNKIKAEQQNYLDILKKLNIDPNASITKQNNQTVIHAEKKLQEQSMVIHDLLSENKKLKDALVVMERRVLEASVDLNLLQDKVEYFEKKVRELKMIEQQQQQQHPSV
jgi:sulfur carrier protein ThiS